MQIVHYLVHWVAIGHASGFSLSILLLWWGNPTCPAGKQLAIKIENCCTSSMASNCSHHERDKDDDNNSGVAFDGIWLVRIVTMKMVATKIKMMVKIMIVILMMMILMMMILHDPVL